MKPQVLMLSPEAPYPLRGGGAYRTASLLHYFARFADVDLIVTSQSGSPALLPPGLVRTQSVIPLPVHGNGTIERYLRNARRAILGIPPLTDRLGGLSGPLLRAIGARRYDIGIVEHFWCAGYVAELSGVCRRTILDLHNIESVLHQRCAMANQGLISLGHRRFSKTARRLESEMIPRFSLVLTASREDAALATAIAPSANVMVYPNSIPRVERPARQAKYLIGFSGNFEYHPNIDAVKFLTREIWPKIRKMHPEIELRLIGVGDKFIRHLIPAGSGIETTGPVEDALTEIASASIVIAPLRTGSGTRIKILEGWAAARPVIATPLAAEGLMAEDDHDIVLAGTAGEFASAVDRLLSDAAERERIGGNGRQTYERNYTWEAAWRALDLNPQLMLSKELNRYTG